MDSKMKGFMMMALGFVILDGFLLTTASAKYLYNNFVVAETPYKRLCSKKNILTVNGRFPGPTIFATKGDTLTVNVINNATINVTLHWHGVKQPRNPWTDGPEYITQCPIQPGANFTYIIILSNEEGTMWWHAHSDWTRATVHGAIVVYPRLGTTYPFPRPYKEVPIVLASWWKRDVMEVLNEAKETGGEPQASDAHTINGQPGDLYPCSKSGTFRMRVVHNRTYLLRMVNAGMNDEHFFAIAQHKLTVVGRDGAYTKPFTTNYIMITPGQSMDILLTTNQTPSHYYMAARAYSSGIRVAFDNTTATAILEYKGNYTPPSSPFFPVLPYYNDTHAATNYTIRLRSLANKDHPVYVPSTVDTRIFMTIAVNTLPCPNNSCDGPNGTRFSASLNNISFATPSIDILGAYYNMTKGVYTKNFPRKPSRFYNFTADAFASYLYTPTLGTRVKVLDYNSSVEIVFQGTNLLAGENHPIHLHGYSFYVIGFGFGNFNKVKDPLKYNLVDPPKVNTIGVPKNGWATIRFRADNPGVWLMHCHFERHTTWGMETVFIVKNGKTSDTRLLEPPEYMPPC